MKTHHGDGNQKFRLPNDWLKKNSASSSTKIRSLTISVAGRLTAASNKPPYNKSISPTQLIDMPAKTGPVKIPPIIARNGIPAIKNSAPAKVITLAAWVLRMMLEQYKPPQRKRHRRHKNNNLGNDEFQSRNTAQQKGDTLQRNGSNQQQKDVAQGGNEFACDQTFARKQRGAQ